MRLDQGGFTGKPHPRPPPHGATLMERGKMGILAGHKRGNS